MSHRMTSGVVLAALALCATAQGAQIRSVAPRIAAPGQEIEIRGQGFGARPGRWQLTMSRIVDRRPQRWEMLILDWADRRIRALVPADAPADGYLVLIARRDRPTVYSNTAVLHVVRPDGRGDGPRYGANDEYEWASVPERAQGGSVERERPAVPWLDGVMPRAVLPGDLLRLRGRDFGHAPNGRIVAINLGRVREAPVLSWSNREVRVRVPRDLGPGEYRVLVYMDRRYVSSSNSLALRVR